MGSVPFSRSNSLQPHRLQHARLPCPSPRPGAYWNSCPLHWWCHPTISSSVVPFSIFLPSIFPSIRVFSVSQFFTSGGQSIRVSASASVLSMNIQDWFPLEWTGSSYIPWVYSVHRYSMASSHITWSKTNLSILFSTLVSSTLFMISLQEITIHSVTLTPNLESPQPGVNSSRSTSLLLTTACKQPHGLGHLMFLESPIFPSPFKVYHPAKFKPHQQSHSLAQAMSWALLPFKSLWLNSKVGQGFKRMTISLPDYDTAVAPDHIMDDSKLLAENPNILHNPTCLPLLGAPTPCFPIVPCSLHTGPFFWAYNSSSLLNLNVGSSTQPSSFLRN